VIDRPGKVFVYAQRTRVLMSSALLEKGTLLHLQCYNPQAINFSSSVNDFSFDSNVIDPTENRKDS